MFSGFCIPASPSQLVQHIFSKIVVEVKVSETATCLKTVVAGMQGHASCIIVYFDFHEDHVTATMLR